MPSLVGAQAVGKPGSTPAQPEPDFTPWPAVRVMVQTSRPPVETVQAPAASAGVSGTPASLSSAKAEPEQTPPARIAPISRVLMVFSLFAAARTPVGRTKLLG